MNKLLIIGLLLTAFLGISIAAGGVIGGSEPKITTTKDYQITLDNTITKDNLQSTIDFNNAKQTVYCDNNACIVTLNKEGVFQNHEIQFNLQQNCLEWNEPICLASNLDGECLNMTQRSCKTWTNYTKDEFIQKAITNELNNIQKVANDRNISPIKIDDTRGKIITTTVIK